MNKSELETLLRQIPPTTWLRAFEATARHLSFAKAAKELNVTPSALSHQVKQLEERLGVKLFERLNRAIKLTEAGERCFPGLRDGFDRLAEAMERVRPRNPDHLLVVTTGPAFAAKWLAPRLFRFVDAFPDMEIRVAASLKLVDFAADGVDVGIRFGNGEYPGLVSEQLIGESVYPVCSPRYAEEMKLESHEDLEHAQLLHDDSVVHMPDAPNWADWLRIAGVPYINDDRGLRFNHADHGIDAAIEGAGIALARHSLTMRDVKMGRLIRPFSEEIKLDHLSFWIVYPEGDEQSEKARIFREWALSEVARDEAELATSAN